MINMLSPLRLATLASLLFLSGSASAGGAFSKTSDILGLSLQMTPSEAKDFIAKNFTNASVLSLPVTVVTPEYQHSFVAGIAFDIKAKQTNDSVLASQGVDRIKLLFNPNDGNDIFAIQRSVNFGANSSITMATLKAQLIEKYGSPAKVDERGQYGVSLLWLANASANLRACTNTGNYYPYFYEDIWADRPLDRTLDETSRGFIEYVNRVTKAKTESFKSCGSLLAISISNQVGNNSAYAYEMRETLIDLPRGASELFQYKTNFFAKVEENKKAKIMKDTQNKPQL